MSDKVTFSKLVEELAEKTGSSQSLSHDFVSGLTDSVINSAMESGKSSITNFGSFSVVDVAARNGVNPRTGESIVIPAHKRLSFSPYKALENTVNAPFAHLKATVINDDDETDSPAPSETTSAIKPLTSLSSKGELEEDGGDKEVSEPESPTDEKNDGAPVFKRPGKEGEKSDGMRNVLILIILLLLVILGTWYFVFRDSSEPQVAEQTPPPVETPADPTPNPPPAVDQTATDSDTPEKSEVLDGEVTEPDQVEIVKENATPNYVVSSGEWIYDIARKNYNQPTFWPLIFEANFSSDQDPDLIIPGKELSIPEITDAQNLTQSDRERLASALRLVSEAYSNAGKSEQAENYSRMAAKFSN